MRHFRLLTMLVLLTVASAVPLEALPPGACYGDSCAMCTITIYSNGDSSLSCGYVDSWGYCTCRLTVDDGCSQSGSCYYHP